MIDRIFSSDLETIAGAVLFGNAAFFVILIFAYAFLAHVIERFVLWRSDIDNDSFRIRHGDVEDYTVRRAAANYARLPALMIVVGFFSLVVVLY